MSNEATKANTRRSKHPEYAQKYLVGHGIDIGCGDDNVGQHRDLYPKILSCRGWDLEDGDAQYLKNIEDNTYDFVHSSHCLEHMTIPSTALYHWLRVLKHGGHAVIIIPDEDLYEQGVWPSTFNSDHKFSFSMNSNYAESKLPNSISVLTLLSQSSIHIRILSIRLNEENFDFTAERHDQSRGEAECSIEFVVRKL